MDLLTCLSISSDSSAVAGASSSWRSILVDAIAVVVVDAAVLVVLAADSACAELLDWDLVQRDHTALVTRHGRIVNAATQRKELISDCAALVHIDTAAHINTLHSRSYCVPC